MRNFFFRALMAVLFLFTISQSHAQKRKQAKDSSVTIVFAENSTASKKRKTSGDDNIIKIAPLGFIGGVFPLLYERKINDFFSVEVAGGLTHRNYIRGAFMKEGGVEIKEYPWGENGYDEAEETGSYDYRKAQMGYMFRVMPKIYFEDDAPDGNYIGLQYNYLKYKSTIPRFTKGTDSYNHNGAEMSEYENITDYMVYFGRQIVNDRITIESSSGIGLRKVKGMKYVATTDNGGVVDGLAPYSQSTINFGITFTLGYHF